MRLPSAVRCGFKAAVSFVDGKPIVPADPDLGGERAYTVEGVENLDDV